MEKDSAELKAKVVKLHLSEGRSMSSLAIATLKKALSIQKYPKGVLLH